MARLFAFGELKTLVARALQSGDYSPADSARIRAVPDTRTIRYYTTLGLLNPPAMMKGRTAYYNEVHVLQIVAIKQLQSCGMSLAEVQRKLMGPPQSKLQPIAKLPDDFWQAADTYLASIPSNDASQFEPEAIEKSEEPFWLPPMSIASEQAAAMNCPSGKVLPTVRLALSGGVTLSIELPSDIQAERTIDVDALLISTKGILEELRRQKLIEG